jgi:hypothetical protein
MIFSPTFLILAWLNLRKTYQLRQFQYYMVQIPIFVIVLVFNFLIVFEVPVPSISSLLLKLLSHFVK